MSKALAIAILRKVGKLLRKIERRQVYQDSSAERELILESKWRQSYHLTRRVHDLEDIVNLRIQIYKVCFQ